MVLTLCKTAGKKAAQFLAHPTMTALCAVFATCMLLLPAHTPMVTHWTAEASPIPARDTFARTVSETLSLSSPFKTHFQSRGGASSGFPMIRLNSLLHWSTKFSERWNSTTRCAAAESLYHSASRSAGLSVLANSSVSSGLHPLPNENFGIIYAHPPLFAASTIFPAVAA